jgi:hypothetical protein
MSSRTMGPGGSSGMTARVAARSRTTGLRLGEKSKLQDSDRSSWSCELSLAAAAGPLRFVQNHPGREHGLVYQGLTNLGVPQAEGKSSGESYSLTKFP